MPRSTTKCVNGVLQKRQSSFTMPGNPQTSFLLIQESPAPAGKIPPASADQGLRTQPNRPNATLTEGLDFRSVPPSSHGFCIFPALESTFCESIQNLRIGMPVPTLLGELPQLLGVPFPFRIDSPDSFQSAAIPLRRTVRRSDGQTVRRPDGQEDPPKLGVYVPDCRRVLFAMRRVPRKTNISLCHFS